MKKSALGLLVLLLAIAGGGVAVWRAQKNAVRRVAPPAAAEDKSVVTPGRGTAEGIIPRRVPAPGEAALDKATRVERIRRDYDEIKAKASTDYAAVGAEFPGGLNAFLRQLALLEREKHADLAAVLTPRELEDLEMREANAGQLVQKLLGDTVATEEQRRAVFRLQRDFDDRFALTFNLTPAILLERESERQKTQRAIIAALGSEELFAVWLRGEGPDYANYRAFAGQQGLPASVALELWAAKNEYTLRRLELNAQSSLPPEQLRATQLALVAQAQARVLSILGAGAYQAAGGDVLGWLPRGK
jgi:hypothetical protein